jgi:hypothetical protein
MILLQRQHTVLYRYIRKRFYKHYTFCLFYILYCQALNTPSVAFRNRSYKSALGTLAQKTRGNSIGTETILSDWVLEKVQGAFDRFDWAWARGDKRSYRHNVLQFLQHDTSREREQIASFFVHFPPS